MRIDNKQVSEALHMYREGALYLVEAEVDFPTLRASLAFPATPVYLVDGTGIQHINNTEVELITNQTMFLFYRQALVEGQLGLPQIPVGNLQDHYNAMFIKQEIDYYERFTDRARTDLVVTLIHKNARRLGTVFLVWCELSIPGFLEAKVVGGVELK